MASAALQTKPSLTIKRRIAAPPRKSTKPGPTRKS